MENIQVVIDILLILIANVIARVWVDLLEPPTKNVTEKSSRLTILSWFLYTDPQIDLSNCNENYVSRLYWKAFHDIHTENTVEGIILEGKKKVRNACYEYVRVRAFTVVFIFILFCPYLVSADIFGTKDVPTEVLVTQLTDSVLETVFITVVLVAILVTAALMCVLAEKAQKYKGH